MLRLFALVPILSLLLAGCSSKTGPEPLSIGQLIQLTGPNKASGLQAERGARLAVDPELRVLGHPVIVRHVDLQDGEAVRLITVNKAMALLVGADGTQADRVAHEAQPYNVPVVVCGELATLPGDNALVLGAGPEARGRALAVGASEVLKVKSVAVLIDGRSPLAAAVAAAFVKQHGSAGEVAVTQAEYVNEQEFKERLDKMLAARPGAVMLAGNLAELARVRAAVRDMQTKAAVLFAGEDSGTSAVKDQDKVGPAVYFATAFAAEGLTEKGREFAARYKEAYGERPDLAAALAYDGTRLLDDTIRQAGVAERVKLRDQLSKTESFESVTGPVLFKKQQARRTVFLMEFQDGEAKVVKTFPPEE